MNLYLTDKKYLNRNLVHFDRVFVFGKGNPAPKVTWIDTVKKPTWRDIIGAVNNRSANDINVIGDRFYDSSIKKLNFANLYGKCVQVGKAYVFQGRINISKEGDFKKNLKKSYEIIKQKKVKFAKRHDNIIAVTSISPYHKNFNQQHEAVISWSKYFKVYSVNSEKEIGLLKRKFKNVEFVKARNTLKEINGKDVVCNKDLIDLAKEKGKDLLLINSDIVLSDFPTPKEGLGIITRHNHKDKISEAKEFRWGFDAFIIPNKYLDIYPPTMFALGVTWHDFWIPYTAIVKGLKVYHVKEKIAYHKDHSVQYHPEEWKRFGEYFRWLFKLDSFTNIGDMCTYIYRVIKNEAVKQHTLKLKIKFSEPRVITVDDVKNYLGQEVEVERV